MTALEKVLDYLECVSEACKCLVASLGKLAESTKIEPCIMTDDMKENMEEGWYAFLQRYQGEKLSDYASETDEQAYDREFMRERQREARPMEQARALARYKAHCTRMTAHKARQQLRRRKYRCGANAGWW